MTDRIPRGANRTRFAHELHIVDTVIVHSVVAPWRNIGCVVAEFLDIGFDIGFVAFVRIIDHVVEHVVARPVIFIDVDGGSVSRARFVPERRRR